jgi:hypothetical protein
MDIPYGLEGQDSGSILGQVPKIGFSALIERELVEKIA